VRVSDGTNTTNLSAVTSATAAGGSNGYASVVRSDAPVLNWSSDVEGSWIQDSGAADSHTRRLSGLLTDNVTTSTDSPIAGDPSGSLSFNGSNGYAWSDEYVPGPKTYTIETWIKTTNNRGGKIVGFGNGRPLTNDTAVARTSGSYDRHIYMENGGRINFGAYTGSAVTLRSPNSLNDGQWHHVVATQGSNGMALYVD